MKKYIPILAVCLFAGCASDETQDYHPELRLLFQPNMYMHVSHEDVDLFTTDRSFGVSAWKLSEGQTWKRDASQAVSYLSMSEARSRKVSFTDASTTGTIEDTLWMVSDNVYWPSQEESLTFLAYSPYSANCSCDPMLGVTYTVNTLENQTDFLYSRLHADKFSSNNGGVVPIQFEHALCKVDFRVKKQVYGNDRIIVKSITLDQAHCRGTFRSLATPHWEKEETLEPLPIFEGNEDIGSVPQSIGRYWMMIPQQLASPVTVEYEYITPTQTLSWKKQTVPLRTGLEAGRSYTFTLLIGWDDVIFQQELLE